MMRVSVVFTVVLSFLTAVSATATPVSDQCSLENLKKRYDFRMALSFLFSAQSPFNIFNVKDSLSRPFDAYAQDIKDCHKYLIEEVSRSGIAQCAMTPNQINEEVQKAVAEQLIGSEHESTIIVMDQMAPSNITIGDTIKKETDLKCENLAIFSADLELSGVESMITSQPVDINRMLDKYFPTLGSNQAGKEKIQEIIASVYQIVRGKIEAALDLDPKKYSPRQVKKLLAPYEDAYNKIENSTYL